MYPTHTQLLAKWSSPSIGDRRATGWWIKLFITWKLESLIHVSVSEKFG